MPFAFEVYDHKRILMLHGREEPPSAEWNRYLDYLRSKNVTELGLLAFTDGGAPNAAQRRALNEVLQGRFFARAIVNDSVLVRGVIAAVSWFAPGVKPFRPNEWRQAAAHAFFSTEMLSDAAARLLAMNERLRHAVPWMEYALSK